MEDVEDQELPPAQEKSCEEVREEPQLSKNQLKKLKKKEKWLAIKQDKRRNAKLKRKLRLAEMRESGEDTGPTRKSLKRKSMKNSSCQIRVVIDLALDDYMSEKDVNSLTCQLQHSYAANRRADNPLQLYLCGVSGKTKERLDRIGDYKGWDMYKETKKYEEVFPKESLVYLSSESDNVLTTLSEDKVYVIGGLVDHNKHKGLCHKLAVEKGIAHAQLPIGEYLDMRTRKVLTVNQVFSILLRYTESNDWKEAFLAEMPQRKQASARQEAVVDSERSSSMTDAQGSSNSQNLNNSGSQEKAADCVDDQVTCKISAGKVDTEARESKPELAKVTQNSETVNGSSVSESNVEDAVADSSDKDEDEKSSQSQEEKDSTQTECEFSENVTEGGNR